VPHKPKNGFKPFVHWTGIVGADWFDRKQHSFNGSFVRHVAVEKALYFLIDDIVGRFVKERGTLETFFKRILETPIKLIFGLNCNFPLRDIALCVVWELKGTPNAYFDTCPFYCRAEFKGKKGSHKEF
jgi:hypothetical protein